MNTRYHGEKYATETLVTDVRTYDVVAHTAKTITVRPRREDDHGELDPRFDHNGHGLGMYAYATHRVLDAPTHVLRLRKDGTYRIAGWAHPLHFTDTPPLAYRDWRN